MVSMNSASTAIDGISLFCLWADKGSKPKAGLPPQSLILLCVDNLAVNDFSNSGLNFIHFLYPQHSIICFQTLSFLKRVILNKQVPEDDLVAGLSE